jgi:hypothetical protein
MSDAPHVNPRHSRVRNSAHYARWICQSPTERRWLANATSLRFRGCLTEHARPLPQSRNTTDSPMKADLSNGSSGTSPRNGEQREDDDEPSPKDQRGLHQSNIRRMPSRDAQTSRDASAAGRVTGSDVTAGLGAVSHLEFALRVFLALAFGSLFGLERQWVNGWLDCAQMRS